MLRATLRSLLRRKLRLVLSALVIVLAVGFVSAAMTLNATLARSFHTAFTSAYDQIQLQVAAKSQVSDADPVVAPASMDASVVKRVAGVAGVAEAHGVVRVPGARLIGRDGKVVGDGTRVGMSWRDGDTSVRFAQGHGPSAPNEIAINADLARQAGYHVGDQTGVLTLAPRQEFTIVGVVTFGDRPYFANGEQTVLFTEPVAEQLLMGQAGAVSAVDVRVGPGADPATVGSSLRSELGDRFVVRTGKELGAAAADQAAGSLKIITAVLLGFAAVTVLVGVFLIINAFSIVVAQRTRELALYRALGASRRQVRRSVLFEALLVGLAAWIVGFALGTVVGQLIANGFTGGDSGLPAATFQLSIASLLVSFAVGVVVTVVAAMVPAGRAAKVPPMAALRDFSLNDRPMTRLTIAGGVLTALGVVLMVVGQSGSSLPPLLGGVLLAFVGTALLIPIVCRPVVGVLGRLIGRSVPARMAGRNAVRHPRRTAGTAATIMIGVALVTGLSTISSSFQTSITHALDEHLNAQLAITAGLSNGAVAPTVGSDVLARVRGLSDVAVVAAYASEPAKVNGAAETVTSWDDLAAAGQVVGIKVPAGASADSGLLLNDKTAERLKVKAGDRLRVQLSRGPEQTIPVAGVYPDTQIADGIVVPWATAMQGFRSAQAAQAYVSLRAGASESQAKQQIGEILRNSPEVEVKTRDELLDDAASALRLILSAVQVLLALAMIIGILGVVNTLALSVLERVRELGVLRAIGMTRPQIRRMMTLESILMATFGALVGIVVGVGLGLVVVSGMPGVDKVSLPWGLMVAYLVAAVAVGALAALGPAARSARMNVLAAISYQ